MECDIGQPPPSSETQAVEPNGKPSHIQRCLFKIFAKVQAAVGEKSPETVGEAAIPTLPTMALCSKFLEKCYVV